MVSADVPRGVHTEVGHPDLPDRALGAWLTSGRSGVITGVAASALHGAEWSTTPSRSRWWYCNTAGSGGVVDPDGSDRGRRDHHGRRYPGGDAGAHRVRLGRHQKRSIALGRLDALMRSVAFDSDEVALLAQRYGPVRGVRQLRELLPLIDSGAASLKESWLRLLLIDNNFPVPETQIPVCDEDGQTFAYLDMGCGVWGSPSSTTESSTRHHARSTPRTTSGYPRSPSVAGSHPRDRRGHQERDPGAGG